MLKTTVIISSLYMTLLMAASSQTLERPPYFAILPEQRVSLEMQHFEKYGVWHQCVILEILFYLMLGKRAEDPHESPFSTMVSIPHPVSGEHIYFYKGNDLNWNQIDDRNMTILCEKWQGITCHERADNGLKDTCWCINEPDLQQYSWADDSDNTSTACREKCRNSNRLAKSSAPLDAITKIDLSGYGLVSLTHFPGVIEQLRFLEVIDLSGNEMIGTLPKEFGNLKGLRHLNLSSNDLLGKFPSMLGRLPNLQVLNLSQANINRTIPNELLTRLSDLESLDLSSNNFRGKIMPIPLNSKLKKLDLSKNHLTGNLPDVERLVNIQELNLSQNEFVGSLPSGMSSMHELRKFDIHWNKLTGNIPSGQWSMPSLEYINLGHNGFDGKIPPDIFNPRLKTLILSHNYLVGKLSSEIEQSKLLEVLHIEGNLLAGTLPKELYQLKEILDVEIYDNKFRGSISTSLCQSDLRSNFPSSYVPFSCTHFIACPKGYFHPDGHASDTHGCVPCPPCHTDDLKDESCRYIGQIECDDDSTIIAEGDIDGDGVVSQREVLRLLFVTTNGNNWKHEFLKWGDVVQYPDACSLPGVNCKEGKVSKIDLREVGLCNNWYTLTIKCGLIPPQIGLLSDSLEVLDLSYSGNGNNFPLTIPSEIGMLTELKILDLSKNKLKGIPSTVSSCKKLKNLNLSQGDLMGTLDPVIWKLSSLEKLDLRDNRFSPQNIPSEIGLLTNLREFKNSRAFFTGPIPDEMCKLVKMKNLEMYGNNLNGEFPECIKNLKELSRLDVFGNKFSGRIDWLKFMPKLEILHLGVNKFVGTIPTEMGSFKSLSWVDLSGNRIFGEIPTSLASLPHLVDLRLGANNLFTIPEELCHSKTINGGQIDDTCDHILCKISTISSRGYTTPEEPCTPCPEFEITLYPGQNSCRMHDQSDFMDILYTAIGGFHWDDEYFVIDEIDECESTSTSCNNQGDIISFDIPISSIEMDESLFTSHAAVFM